MVDSQALTERFELYGKWWLDDEDRSVHGVLVYDPTEGVLLETVDARPLIPIAAESPSTIRGIVDGEGWTLGACHCVQMGNRCRYSVGYAIRGVLMDDRDLSELTELRLSLHEGRALTRTRPRLPESSGRMRSLTADLGDGWTLGLESTVEQLLTPREDELRLVDRLEFVVRSASPSDFYELVRRVYRPLLEIGAICAQQSVSVSHAAISGPGTQVVIDSGPNDELRQQLRCDLYWKLRPAPRRPVRDPEPLFRFPTDQEAFSSSLPRWFDVHAKLFVVFGLRQLDLSTEFAIAEPRLMVSAQAIEAVHRRVVPASKGRRPALRRRIEDLLELVHPQTGIVLGEHREWFVSEFVRARNTIVHWDVDQTHPPGLVMLALHRASTAIVDLVLLRELGFDDELDNLAQRIDGDRQARYWLDRAASASE
ncbi:MAG: hypothetical protein RIB65_18620 [Ilumatobacter fluminis]|uniref:ApeA N-terminal domain 1-containing protein n=1 Tax=Ilumatobacter fluminis TaxID=467091 RepID=UPI0032EE519A